MAKDIQKISINTPVGESKHSFSKKKKAKTSLFQKSPIGDDIHELKELMKTFLASQIKSPQVAENSNASQGILAVLSRPMETQGKVVEIGNDSKGTNMDLKKSDVSSPQHQPSPDILYLPPPPFPVEKRKGLFGKIIIKILEIFALIALLILFSVLFYLLKINSIISIVFSVVITVIVAIVYYVLKRILKRKPIVMQSNVQVSSMPVTNVQRCPRCDSKLMKSNIINHGTHYSQFVKCKNPACDFQKEIQLQ